MRAPQRKFGLVTFVTAFAALLFSCNLAFAQATTRLAPGGGGLTHVACGSAVSSCVLKASAGQFYGVYANCTSACWVMLFNATSAPSNGATTAGNASGNLVECFEVAAGASKSLVYSPYPIAFSVGITAAISSTACASLTLSTVGFVSGSVF